jgi:uncharacterized repeat protein (TIGR01451 family)
VAETDGADALWTQLGVATTALGLVVAVVGTGLPGIRLLAGLVVLAGLVGAGAGAALARRERRRERARTGRHGQAVGASVPGDAVARTVDAGGDRTARETLERLAVTARREAGDGEETARRRIRRGSWSDDPDAVAFLRGDRPTLTERVRARLAGTTARRRWANRAAAEVARRYDVDSGGESGATGADGEGDGSNRARRTDGGRDVSDSAISGTATVTEVGADPAADTDDRATDRWTGVLVPVLAGVALGVLTGQPAVVLAAGVPVGVAAYARLDSTPAPALSVSRSISRSEAAVGDRIEVTLSVENVGDATLSELLVRDGTPPGLPVVEGTPELVTALRPGRSATIQYTVEARRGRHDFEPVEATVRGAAGALERRRRIAATDGAGDPALDVVTCIPPLPTGGQPPPLSGPGGTTPGPGRSTTTGGGVEFAGVREYRHGDPYGRIDWRRYARTGERFTIEYVEDRLASVLVVVDARRAAYCTAPDGTLAVDSCVRAATAACAGLLAAGHRVGLAAAAPRTCRVPPGTGTVHARRLERELATAPALGRRPPGEPLDAAAAASDLGDRLGGVDALVVVSPLVDDGAVTLARSLDALGPGVSVLGVDPTGTDGPWRRIARVERADRIRRLRSAGVKVDDGWHRKPGAATGVAGDSQSDSEPTGDRRGTARPGPTPERGDTTAGREAATATVPGRRRTTDARPSGAATASATGTSGVDDGDRAPAGDDSHSEEGRR